MTNLARFNTVERSNKGVEVRIKDPKTGAGTDAYITILGMDGDTYQQFKDERARDMADRAAAGRATALTAEERRELTALTLARCTIGWRGLEEEEGDKPLEYSDKAAIRLYLNYPAIRDQVNEEIANRANFVKS